MKMKLIMENWRGFTEESPEPISENIENTNNLLLELDDLNARHVMSSIKKVPLKDRPGNDIFGDKWRIVKDFSSEEDLTMKSIHKFLTKKNYTLGAKSEQKDISFIPPGGGERKTKKEIRFDLLYREPARDLPQHVLDKIAAGEIKAPKRRELSIQKALGKFKKELGEKYDKWVDFLQSESFEYFTKAKPGEHGVPRPNYKDFLASGSDQYVIYSRHPIDIVRMSDFKSVKSCHTPGSSHFDNAKKEALGKGGAVVLYVQRNLIDKFLKDNKMTIEEYLDLDEIFADPCRTLKYKNLPVPSGRVRLRNAIVKTDSWDASVLVPEKRRYGQVPPGSLNRLRAEISDLQSKKTSHFMDLISKKLGPQKERKGKFLETIKKELAEHHSRLRSQATRNLEKFPGLKFSQNVSIAELFSTRGRDAWDHKREFHAEFSNMFLYLPQVYKDKVHLWSKQEASSKFASKEEIVQFLSKAFRTASHKKLRLYGKTYHMIDQTIEHYKTGKLYGAIPKISHIPEHMLLGDNEMDALKEIFLWQLGKHFKATSNLIYHEHTDYIEMSDIFTDIELSGGKYIDTNIKTLFNDFLLSSSVISTNEEGKFAHDWEDEFAVLRDSVLKEYLKEVELGFDRFINKDTLNRLLYSTSHHRYRDILTQVYSFISEVSKFSQKHANNTVFYENYDTISKLSKKARAVQRAGLGSIGDVVRNGFNVKFYINKIKEIGFDDMLGQRFVMSGALTDEIVIDAYEGFIKQMKTLPPELFFAAKDYFMNVIRPRGLGYDMMTPEHIQAIKDHAAYLESKGDAPKEKRYASGYALRKGEADEEDEWVAGELPPGLSESKKPRKKRIIKIKIKGGK